MSVHRKSDAVTTTDPMMNMRPPKRGCWEQFSLLLYNKEKGTFLNRTCLSWVKILGFYTIFYAALCGFFAVCMYFMLKTIDPLVPKYYGDRSVLRSPGMSVRPHPPVEGNRVIVWNVNHSSWENIVTTADEMNKFFAEYYHPPNNTVPCDFGKSCMEKRTEGIDSCTEEIPKDKVCEVKYQDWGLCTPESGKKEGLNIPCLYFRLNKLYKWRPDYYDNSQDLPEMPDFLREKINNTPLEKRDRVWLSCQAIIDEDKTEANPSYFPEQWEGSFPGYFYPWHRQPNYTSAVVAVYFGDTPYDKLLNVDCKLWAKNIVQDKKYEVAWLTFKIKLLFSDS